MKRLFTLFIILFCFAEVRAQIIWERIEKDTITYRDEFMKVMVKDSLIFLNGRVWTSTTNIDRKRYYACYNLNGKLKWFKNGRDEYHDLEISDLVIDSDSMLFTYRYDRNNFKLYLQNIRMETGDTLKARRFTVPYSFQFIAKGLIIKDQSGSYTIGADGPILSRLSNSGVPIWTKIYVKNFPNGNTRFDDVGDFVQLKNGQYLFSGTRGFNSPSGYSQHPVLIKYNTNGDTLFSKVLTINNWQHREDNWFSNVIETRLGDYLFSGRDDTTGTAQWKFFLTKVDPQLNIKWTYFNNGVLKDYSITKVQELADSSFIVLARARYGLASNYALINISKNGTYLAHKTYTNTFCGLNMLWDMKLLPDGTAIVAGKCKNGYSYVSRVTGFGPPPVPEVLGNAEELGNAGNYLAEAYPNPANETVTFTYNLPAKVKQAEIQIFEIATGKIIKQVQLKSSERQQQISLAQLNSGMYAYTIIADGIPVSTKKLAVVK